MSEKKMMKYLKSIIENIAVNTKDTDRPLSGSQYQFKVKVINDMCKMALKRIEDPKYSPGRI